MNVSSYSWIRGALVLTILLMSLPTPVLAASKFVYVGYLDRFNACDGGYGLRETEMSPPRCLESKKIDLSSLRGRRVRLGVHLKSSHGTMSVWEVDTLNPQGNVGFQPNGFERAVIAVGNTLNPPEYTGSSTNTPTPEYTGSSTNTLVAVSASTAPLAQNAGFVPPVPQCGTTKYVNNQLYLRNLCGSEVYMVWTSRGDVGGGAHLAPDSSSDAGQSLTAVRSAGGIHIFTCPGVSVPADPQGRPISTHYVGSYQCRK